MPHLQAVVQCLFSPLQGQPRFVVLLTLFLEHVFLHWQGAAACREIFYLKLQYIIIAFFIQGKLSKLVTYRCWRWSSVGVFSMIRRRSFQRNIYIHGNWHFHCFSNNLKKTLSEEKFELTAAHLPVDSTNCCTWDILNVWQPIFWYANEPLRGT